MQSVPAGLAPPRTSTPRRLPFALYASILIALLAASSAPTPLYPWYQAQWQLSALDITVVFSAYALALLTALLTTGTLSDHVGRRPVLLGALAVQVASMALFATAGGLTTLIVPACCRASRPARRPARQGRLSSTWKTPPGRVAPLWPTASRR